MMEPTTKQRLKISDIQATKDIYVFLFILFLLNSSLAFSFISTLRLQDTDDNLLFFD